MGLRSQRDTVHPEGSRGATGVLAEIHQGEKRQRSAVLLADETPEGPPHPGWARPLPQGERENQEGHSAKRRGSSSDLVDLQKELSHSPVSLPRPKLGAFKRKNASRFLLRRSARIWKVQSAGQFPAALLPVAKTNHERK